MPWTHNQRRKKILGAMKERPQRLAEAKRASLKR
jgi:hypothetical protein